MLIKQKKVKKRYHSKLQSFKGKGFLDSFILTADNSLTSKALKIVAVNLSKTVATKLGEKAIEKATDKIFTDKSSASALKKEPSEISPKARMLVDNIILKGRIIRKV
jgi:hypothetical protein